MMEEDLLKSKIPVVHSLYKKGEFNKAYQISEEISNKYINNSYVQNLHGVVCIALNNWETAKNYFIKALKIKNNSSEAYNNLGLSYLNLGNLEDALKNFLSAIEIKSDYASPHNNILKTRDLDGSILPGITRNTILKCAKKNKISVREEKFKIDDLYNAKEVFITSASSFVTPVKKVNETLINNGITGYFANKLRIEYFNFNS